LQEVEAAVQNAATMKTLEELKGAMGLLKQMLQPHQ
jgi:hypothetical protein